MFELIAIIVFKASPKSIFIFHLSAKIVIFSFSTYIPDEMSDSVFFISFYIRTDNYKLRRSILFEVTFSEITSKHLVRSYLLGDSIWSHYSAHVWQSAVISNRLIENSIHPFSFSNYCAETICRNLLEEVSIASFNGESRTHSPRADADPRSSDAGRSSSPEVRVRMIQIVHVGLRIEFKKINTSVTSSIKSADTNFIKIENRGKIWTCRKWFGIAQYFSWMSSKNYCNLRSPWNK